jgi:hypothetical protein
MANFPFLKRGSSKPLDVRRHHRYAVAGGTVEAWWLDVNGRMRVTFTRVLNVSEEGIALELPAAVMPLRIRFRSDRYGVNGMGLVKHCRPDGSRFVVGLEFTDRLHWQPPPAHMKEPIPLSDPISRR